MTELAQDIIAAIPSLTMEQAEAIVSFLSETVQAGMMEDFKSVKQFESTRASRIKFSSNEYTVDDFLGLIEDDELISMRDYSERIFVYCNENIPKCSIRNIVLKLHGLEWIQQEYTSRKYYKSGKDKNVEMLFGLLSQPLNEIEWQAAAKSVGLSKETFRYCRRILVSRMQVKRSNSGNWFQVKDVLIKNI